MANYLVLLEQIISFIGVYYIVTVGLNIKAGNTGIPDFGHAMFFAMGGIVIGNIVAHIAAAIAASSVPGVTPSGVIASNTETLTLMNEKFFPYHPWIDIGLLILALILAALLGGLLGWVASFPALRLRGEYLAILLLTVAEGLRVFFTYTKQLMGSTPTVGLSTPDLFAWTHNSALAATVFTAIIAILIYIYVERLHNSPAGRLLRAVRDDEDAAKALGKDVVAARRDAMIIGSALAGIAGLVYALNPFLGGGSVAAVSIFNRVWWTFWPWALMILGGMASNRGTAFAVVIIGVSLIWPIRLYRYQLTHFLRVESLGISPDAFANALEYIFIGLLILLVQAFRPQGVIPEPPSRTLPFEKYARGRILPPQPEEKR
jgi:branched-chain amino acid transport system permease protein